MLFPAWYDVHVADAEDNDVFAFIVSNSDVQFPIEHHKELVGVGVRVPNVFALYLGDPNVVVIDLGQDSRTPELFKRAENLMDIDCRFVVDTSTSMTASHPMRS